MNIFSQRLHLEPIELKFQKEEMDTALRTRLWNLLDRFYWSCATQPFYVTYDMYRRTVQNPIYPLAVNIQENFYNEPIDELGNN